MSIVRITNNVPTRQFRLLRLAVIGVISMLMLVAAANPAFAQTPAPAAPTNLTAELTETDGEVQLTWDAAEGATSYRVCRRVQNPLSGWSCISRTATNVLFTGLTVDKTYDFAVASYDGRTYSSWVWTEATVETVAVLICPITGIAIPDGYLSVNETMTGTSGWSFTLREITRKPTITLSGTKYTPFEGRQYLKVCGTVKASSDSRQPFLAGYTNNLTSDLGMGFLFPDHSETTWRDVGSVPAGQTRSACDVWDVPADAATILYAINDFQANPAVFRVDLPAQ